MQAGQQARPNAACDRIVFERGLRRTAVSLPRHGVASLALATLLIFGWALVAAGYIAFHDVVVQEIRRGADVLAKGYEAQLVAMRDELERTRTRRLVEQAGVDQRVAELAARQTAIEKRQRRLVELADAVTADPAPGSEIAPAYSAKPTPFDQPADALDAVGTKPGDPRRRASAVGAMETVSSGLDAVESAQTRTIDGLSARTRERRLTLERVYDAAQLPLPLATDRKGRGGPFEPLPAGALGFEARVERVMAERMLVASFERGLNRVPLRTPSAGASISSGFGARTDPFLGRPAFHAGLDFEGDLGEPVKATAAGRVVSAGWSGGYGNMVEIDHGGGLTTRFGHLSAIAAQPGEEVRIGTVIGRVGSTGRSTGPHIHYETRVDGEAVDPLRFLNAGRILARTR